MQTFVQMSTRDKIKSRWPVKISRQILKDSMELIFIVMYCSNNYNYEYSMFVSLLQIMLLHQQSSQANKITCLVNCLSLLIWENKPKIYMGAEKRTNYMMECLQKKFGGVRS